jgi:hypothetical protein
MKDSAICLNVNLSGLIWYHMTDIMMTFHGPPWFSDVSFIIGDPGWLPQKGNRDFRNLISDITGVWFRVNRVT